MICGIYLGEWLLWNWWRLRYEPRRAKDDNWIRAHSMAEIGHGFVWPRVTISSDGFRSMISAERSSEERSFRFTGAIPQLIAWADVEKAIDDFSSVVSGRLAHHGASYTNFERLLEDLRTERSDPEVGRLRRLEAEMGFDPDELSEDYVRSILSEGSKFGSGSIGEIAATAKRQDDMPEFALPLASIQPLAHAFGIDAKFEIPIPAMNLIRAQWSKLSASEVGVNLAQLVRTLHVQHDGPITDKELGELCSISAEIFGPRTTDNKTIAYSLRENSDKDRLVFRSRYSAGRRFEAARVFSDRAIAGDEALAVATGTKTYRQKAQRSFAAEFLAPITSVVEFCESDFSEARLQEAADYFSVSSMLIESLLKNNGYLPRTTADFMDAA